MQLATGIVVEGKVVLEGEPLSEGTVVTILAREANETFEEIARFFDRHLGK